MTSNILQSIGRSPLFLNATVQLEKALEYTSAGAALAGTTTVLVNAKMLHTELSKTSDNIRPGRVILHIVLGTAGVAFTALSVMNIFNISVRLPWPGSSQTVPTSLNETFANKTLIQIQTVPLVLAPPPEAATVVTNNQTLIAALNLASEPVKTVTPAFLAKPEAIAAASTFNNATMSALDAAPKPVLEVPGILPRVEQPFSKLSDFKLELTPKLTPEQRDMCDIVQPLVQPIVKPVETEVATQWYDSVKKLKFW